MSKKLSLKEATIKELYGELKDKNSDLEGIMDGVLIITDPEIDTEQYQELIDRAKEIIEDTPEGELPLDDSYIGQYVQLCPICGTTFVEDHILEPGSSCPICFQEPEAFTLLGQIQGEEDAEATATDGNLDKEENTDEEDDTGFASTLTDEDVEEEESEPDKLAASEQVQTSNNKLTESDELDFVRGEQIEKEIQDMLDRAYDREYKVGIEEDYWKDREDGKCYKCGKVIPEDEKYIIDGQQYCLDCKGDAEQELLDQPELDKNIDNFND